MKEPGKQGKRPEIDQEDEEEENANSESVESDVNPFGIIEPTKKPLGEGIGRAGYPGMEKFDLEDDKLAAKRLIKDAHELDLR